MYEDIRDQFDLDEHLIETCFQNRRSQPLQENKIILVLSDYTGIMVVIASVAIFRDVSKCSGSTSANGLQRRVQQASSTAIAKQEIPELHVISIFHNCVCGLALD